MCSKETSVTYDKPVTKGTGTPLTSSLSGINFFNLFSTDKTSLAKSELGIVMDSQLNHSLLQKPIEDLNVSELFRMDFLKAGFETLQEALEYEADALVKEKGFSYHTITELINLLKAEGLERLLKD